jgi:hypothetical protein
MHRSAFLILTALLEVGTGILLMCRPSVPLVLLLGASDVAPDTMVVAQIAGAALVSIGVASGLARNEPGAAVVTGILIYDAAAAAILSYAGLFLNFAGIALWPAVALHSSLAVWCLFCLRDKPAEK